MSYSLPVVDNWAERIITRYLQQADLLMKEGLSASDLAELNALHHQVLKIGGLPPGRAHLYTDPPEEPVNPWE